MKISDLGPFRAARANVLRALMLEEATYGWAVEMILKGAIAGFRVIEVPVSYHPRIGKSKISGTIKGTMGAAWFILSRIVRYYFQRRQPRRVRNERRKLTQTFYGILQSDTRAVCKAQPNTGYYGESSAARNSQDATRPEPASACVTHLIAAYCRTR